MTRHFTSYYLWMKPEQSIWKRLIGTANWRKGEAERAVKSSESVWRSFDAQELGPPVPLRFEGDPWRGTRRARLYVRDDSALSLFLGVFRHCARQKVFEILDPLSVRRVSG